MIGPLFNEVRVGLRPDAEDVSQEVLLKAYLALDRYRGEARFRTWLRRIAANEAYNSRRKTRERITKTGVLPDQAVKDVAIEGILERQILLKVLQQLPYPYREALVLRHIEGLDLAEIARSLDIATGAAKMRLKRARDRFTEVYAAIGGGQ